MRIQENKISRKTGVILIVSGTVVAAVIIAASAVNAWTRGLFLPGWIEWKQYTEYDISQDPEILRITLNNKMLTVNDGTEGIIWQADKDILVQDFLYEDIDHDGVRELLILCWKIGKYGERVPQFGSGEDHKWHQHIYIYRWQDEIMKPIWMASEIGLNVKEWRFDTEERLVLTEPDGRETHWDWIDWGLESITD